MSLAIVLALVVLWVQVPLVHDHATEEPGLYDHECALAKCAAGSTGLLPIAAMDGPPLSTTEAVVAAHPHGIEVGVTSPFGARAPPGAAAPLVS